MAPGSGKRKRGPERQFQNEDGQGRPSPHRPGELDMARRGDREGGRSGRSGGRRQSRQGGPEGANAVPVTPRNVASPAPQQLQPPPPNSAPPSEISRTSTPVQTVATAAPQPVEETPGEPPAPYDYEHISDDIVESWQERGKQSIVDAAKEADEVTLSIILQELVRSGLDGRLPTAETGSLVRQIMHEKPEMDVQSLFLGTISLLDAKDMRNKALLQTVAATNIDPETLRRELDVPLVMALPLVRSSFDKMRTRKTTNVLYRQANFNLLREETEGYAKLITEFFNIAEEVGSSREAGVETAAYAFQRIKALVGSFDLDVGRVLDITMDISSNALVKAHAFFIAFYRCSSWWPKDGVYDNVKWEDETGFNAFPEWALPGSDRPLPTEHDLQQRTIARQTRDQQFWDHVRETGVDAFLSIGARKIVDFDSYVELFNSEVQPETNAKDEEPMVDKRKRINESRKYMRETKTLPPPGNSDAAQVLGFKLRFYTSQARDAEDLLPDGANLFHFAALLIKIGFVSLRDLYPHLYPLDADMPAERIRLQKEKAEKEAEARPGGGTNPLTNSAPLTDDTMPSARGPRIDKDRSGGTTPKPDKKAESEEKPILPPTNQKISILKALLALGAIPDALYILGRFPWLVEVDVSIAPWLLRIAKHMLCNFTDTTRPLRSRPRLDAPKEQLLDTAPRPDATLQMESRPLRKAPTKWLRMDSFNEIDGFEGKYYYTDWAENVPVCQTLDDVFTLCNNFLSFVGPRLGQDVVVYGTLLRLARQNLTEDGSDTNRARWLDLMKRLLVPALSFSKHNPSLTEELYQLLMLFPITTRYNIYAEWFTGRTSRLPDVRAAFEHNKAEVKEVLRRVSNDNVKIQARALGKVSYSSPGILIMFMINQLESYSNMIPSMVECTKYFPKLAYDVMIWSLINALSGRGRDRMQADGMLTSPWLQALSQFVASLFHRHSDINPSPILQYLASELRAGNSTDLELLDQVLNEMAGIQSDIEFTDAQVLLMSGGEHLQAIALQQLGDCRHTRKSTAKRLIRALAEPSLIGQMLISIAQEREMYAHHESSKLMPLKVLGNNVDKIQQVFAQYLEVLQTNLKPEDFEAAVPDVVSLIGEFGLRPAVAFTICRYAIAHRVAEFDEAKELADKERRKQEQKQEKLQTNGDVEMQESDHKPTVDGEASALALKSESSVNGPEAGQTETNGASQIEPAAPNGSAPSAEAQWHPVLVPIIERLPEVTGDLKERVGIEFYVTFWTLGQSDVTAPVEGYNIERRRLDSQISEIRRDRADKSALADMERNRKVRALEEVRNKLSSEIPARIAAYRRKITDQVSKCEKQHWFGTSRAHADLDARHANLLQECFLPRAMLSARDAHYSFLMLKMLHDKGAPGFSTLHLLVQLFRKQELAAIIFQCTALEAQHFGRFMNEVLKLVASWHGDVKVYNSTAIGDKTKMPGFAIKMDDPEDQETWKFMDFENFRRQVFNWHAYLAGALQICFESGEYMHIRNGIIVLKAVVQVFPALNFHGKNLMAQMDRLSKEDERQDLKLMAVSLLGQLKGREKAWKMPQAFRENVPSKDGKPGSRSTSARPETPQPGTGTPKLDATAPEFKPGQANQVNGTAQKDTVAGIEDGEVEEEKQAAAKAGDTEMKDVPAPASEPGRKEASLDKLQQDKAAPVEQKPVSRAPAKEESQPIAPTPSAPKTQSAVNGDGRRDQSRPPSTHPVPVRPTPAPRASHSDKPLPPPPIAKPEGRVSSRNEERFGRLDRPNDSRPSSRDQPSGYHSRPQTPPVASRGHAREERPRDPRDNWRRDEPQPAAHSRPPMDHRDRMNGPMGPPASQNAQISRPGHLESVVSAPAAQEPAKPSLSAAQPSPSPATQSQFNENNERLRLIQAVEEGERIGNRDAPQPDRDQRRGRDGRDERNDPAYSQRAETRSNGRGPISEPPREPQSRRELPPDLAPSGPRNGHGRLNGPSAQQDINYGRLDRPNQPHDMPGAPRAPNGPSGRGARNFTAPQLNHRSSDQPPSSPASNRPPESPAALRPQAPRQVSDGRINGASQYDRQSGSNSVPTTPAGEHGPTVHPSRLGIINPQVPQAPRIDTNLQAANGHGSASSPTSAPPSGPRGRSGRAPLGPPSGPGQSPVTNGPPTGPLNAVDRAMRDRQRGAINSQLASANAAPRGPDLSFRGASSRQNSNSMASAAAMPPVQAVASPMEPPQQRRNEPSHRQDGPPSRPDSRAEARQQQDLFNRGNAESANYDGRHRRRDDEQQQRGSRHASRERRADDEPPRRPQHQGMDDGRDKHGAPRDDRRPRDERDRRDGPPRDTRGSAEQQRGGRSDEPPRRPMPDMPGSFNGPPANWQGRDQGRDGGRGAGGRSDDFRGGRREEERRDGGGRGPSRDDGPPRGDGPPDGRKRRHDEAPFDPSKRRRSGR